MHSKQSFRWSTAAGAALLSGALLWQTGAMAQDVLEESDQYGADNYADSYFDTPNWIEDDYGWYDEDFSWETEAGWYDDWNDTDLTAWSNDEVEQGHWGILGYDDAGDLGLFDW